MNDETLERLLIDRSLGALSADAAALLDAYLRDNPAAARTATAFDETAGLIRQSLPAAPAASLPPFPRARLHDAHRNAARWRIVRSALALAACVVLGFSLGSRPLGGPVKRENTGPAVASVLPRDGRASDRVNESAESDFWSAQRMRVRFTSDSRAASRRVVWNSPVARPSLGGQS